MVMKYLDQRLVPRIREPLDAPRRAPAGSHVGDADLTHPCDSLQGVLQVQSTDVHRQTWKQPRAVLDKFSAKNSLYCLSVNKVQIPDLWIYVAQNHKGTKTSSSFMAALQLKLKNYSQLLSVCSATVKTTW